MRKFTPTIGVEIHVQLATKSKMFCACNNDSRGAKPNTNICPVCMALPGTLPVVNKGTIELAIKLGRGFNAEIAQHTSFDRKNYFYPDSPKGYQITQMDEPIIQAGHVEILVGGEFKKIGIHHAHLEEDAGKLTHPAKADYSLVDFNRAGTPLIEIVSEPELHSPEEAKRYLQEVYNIATSLGVSNGDMEHGNFKFDLNVSVSDTNELGTKVELKNLNSFRNAERALSYEIKRQTDMLEKNEEIVQETRGWNDAKSQTFSQRSKEEANDYRYFPEPDIPPLVITKAMVEEVADTITVLPIEVRKELIELGLNVDEQDVLIGQPSTLEIYNDTVALLKKNPSNSKELSKKAVNWLVGPYQELLKNSVRAKRFQEKGFVAVPVQETEEKANNEKTKLTGKLLAELLGGIATGEISSKIAKDIFPEMVSTGQSYLVIIERDGLTQVSDEGELEAIVKNIIDNNPQAAADYKAGQDRALGFFVGQVMKETKGQANPGKVNALVIKLLKG